MCVYCLIADWANRWVPDQPKPWSPWEVPPRQPDPLPTSPNAPLEPLPPLTPAKPSTYQPWTREQLEEFEQIVTLVKEMEEKLGTCPCEDPSKMDFLNAIRERLDRIDEDAATRKPDKPDTNACG